MHLIQNIYTEQKDFPRPDKKTNHNSNWRYECRVPIEKKIDEFC